MSKKYWLGYKFQEKSPSTYHAVDGKTKNDAIGKFLKGSRFIYSDVVIRRSPPKSSQWETGKYFSKRK